MNEVLKTLLSEKNIKLSDWIFKVVVLLILAWASSNYAANTAALSAIEDEVDSIENNLIQLSATVNTFVQSTGSRFERNEEIIRYLERRSRPDN